MSEIRIAKLLSRDVDVVQLRVGRSASQSHRLVLLCDEGGHPLTEVCRVHFPSDVPHPQSLAKLEKVMSLLDAGMAALNPPKNAQEARDAARYRYAELNGWPKATTPIHPEPGETSWNWGDDCFSGPHYASPAEAFDAVLGRVESTSAI